MTTATLSVPSISCGHCVVAITNQVKEVAGVENVDISIEDKTVTVEGNVDLAAVEAAIEAAGYEVDR